MRSSSSSGSARAGGTPLRRRALSPSRCAVLFSRSRCPPLLLLVLIRDLRSQVYHSYTIRPDAPVQLPPFPGTILTPRIPHFSPSAIHFVDDPALRTPRGTPIHLILATGYSLSIPFLSPHLLEQHAFDPAHPRPPSALETSGAYLRPLWRDVLAGPEALPPTALGVVGLPSLVRRRGAGVVHPGPRPRARARGAECSRGACARAHGAADAGRGRAGRGDEAQGGRGRAVRRGPVRAFSLSLLRSRSSMNSI